MSVESKVADAFNEFFSNVKELKIEKDDKLLTDVIEESDLVLKAIKKYKNYPSILRKKILLNIQNYFGLNIFNVEDVKREFNNINSKKATPRFSSLNNGGRCSALLVDLSKDFDCIVQDLLLAKLSAYGFYYNSLKLINSFLSRRKLRTKIGSSHSPYLNLLVSVPKGSILGPFLFNIYMGNLFLCDFESTIRHHPLCL